MHIYLFQQVHEAGVDLGQKAQEEDEWEAQGKHWRGGGEAKTPSACRLPLGPPLGPRSPRATAALPSLTSGHVTGTEEEGGREECEAVEGDGWEGLSRAQGIQQPDEQTADAEVDRPAVCNHPVVALGSGPVRSQASPTDHPAGTCTLTHAHAHTPGLALNPREKSGRVGAAGLRIWGHASGEGALPFLPSPS